MKKTVLMVFCLLFIMCTQGKTAAIRDFEIIYWPIKMTEHREELILEYSKMHYGESRSTIVPLSIVIHWTASSDAQSTYNYFYTEETNNSFYVKQGRLNVAAHYLVDQNGIIFQLTPETMLNRHVIGLNWCSIGIENVGGVNGVEDLTQEQLIANEKLIRYLVGKYPQIQYVIGHYQQNYAKNTFLWKELAPGYVSEKIDPGINFMRELLTQLKDLPLKSFPL